MSPMDWLTRTNNFLFHHSQSLPMQHQSFSAVAAFNLFNYALHSCLVIPTDRRRLIWEKLTRRRWSWDAPTLQTHYPRCLELCVLRVYSCWHTLELASRYGVSTCRLRVLPRIPALGQDFLGFPSMIWNADCQGELSPVIPMWDTWILESEAGVYDSLYTHVRHRNPFSVVLSERSASSDCLCIWYSLLVSQAHISDLATLLFVPTSTLLIDLIYIRYRTSMPIRLLIVGPVIVRVLPSDRHSADGRIKNFYALPTMDLLISRVRLLIPLPSLRRHIILRQSMQSFNPIDCTLRWWDGPSSTPCMGTGHRLHPCHSSPSTHASALIFYK